MAPPTVLWSRQGAEPAKRLVKTEPDTEADLEQIIEQCPGLVRDDLLVVARQFRFSTRDRVDLLCLQNQTRWTIVELKRDKMPREVVAQAMDYAAQLTSMSAADLAEALEVQGHLKSLNPDDRQVVQRLLAAEAEDQAADSRRDVAAIVVGMAAATGLKRIADYLDNSFGVPISVLELQAFWTPGGGLIFAREETGAEDGDLAAECAKSGPSSLDERWEKVRASAAQYGFTDALKDFRSSIERAGLFPRPYTRSIMVAPPQARNRYLAVASFTGHLAGISYGPDAWNEFFPTSRKGRSGMRLVPRVVKSRQPSWSPSDGRSRS